MAASEERRVLLVAVGVAQAVVVVWLSALGWGGWRALLAHPARGGFVVLTVVSTVVALLSPVNLGSGEREDVASRRLLVPVAAGVLTLAWLMPFMDRRALWTIDGDGARYVGLAMLTIGSALRIWPMFVLGRRFSGLVAIQPGHALVTDGPYGYVRHPSYLGMMLGFFGWALVFRSSVGVVAGVLGFRLLVERIDAEEALLASQFGAAYAEYRRRTWRLVPWLY
jgi:protein-S-isoprenylcysteine O-methyltransferase Ste14